MVLSLKRETFELISEVSRNEISRLLKREALVLWM